MGWGAFSTGGMGEGDDKCDKSHSICRDIGGLKLGKGVTIKSWKALKTWQRKRGLLLQWQASEYFRGGERHHLTGILKC